MKVPLKAEVFCQDGLYGKTIEVIVHPVKELVTHIVIQNKHNSKEVLVPIEEFCNTSDSTVTIDKKEAEIDHFPEFLVHEYIKVKEDEPKVRVWGGNSFMANVYYQSPYVLHHENGRMDVVHEAIPEHEIAMKRGMKVYDSSEHKVGIVDELVIEEESDKITHLVLREGHLWGAKDVSVPALNIAKIREKGVHLNITREEIGELPEVVIKRYWE